MHKAFLYRCFGARLLEPLSATRQRTRLAHGSCGVPRRQAERGTVRPGHAPPDRGGEARQGRSGSGKAQVKFVQTCKVCCRVGREVSHPGPSPDPDKEISTIRLFRRCGSGLRISPTFRSPGDMVSNVNALGMVPS